MVGMNAAMLAPAGGDIGIGFSFPAAMAQRVIAELLWHGRTSCTQLGLSMEDLTGIVAEALGLSSSRGVLVNNAVSGSPANRAGIIAADVVLAVDGRPVGNLGAMSAEVATFAAGHKVQLDVWRGGGPTSVELVPVPKPDAAGRAKKRLDVAMSGSMKSP
jgi:S1-C subfamily serine protease